MVRRGTGEIQLLLRPGACNDHREAWSAAASVEACYTRMFQIRQLSTADYPFVISVTGQWCGGRLVRAVTSLVNRGSVAFHQRMGFLRQ